MDMNTVCPNCRQAITKVGNFWICPEHVQVLLEQKHVSPLRIFLSYGQDASEELVRRIKADLEKRDNDVLTSDASQI